MLRRKKKRWLGRKEWQVRSLLGLAGIKAGCGACRQRSNLDHQVTDSCWSWGSAAWISALIGHDFFFFFCWSIRIYRHSVQEFSGPCCKCFRAASCPFPPAKYSTSLHNGPVQALWLACWAPNLCPDFFLGGFCFCDAKDQTADCHVSSVSAHSASYSRCRPNVFASAGSMSHFQQCSECGLQPGQPLIATHCRHWWLLWVWHVLPNIGPGIDLWLDSWQTSW